MSALIEGLGHGALGLIGLGSVYDPMGDLRSELADKNNQMQQYLNGMSFAVLQQEQREIDKFWAVFQQNNATTSEIMKYNSTLINDNLKEQTLFLAILSMLVIIIIIFMIV